jgi:hypothetical protein
MRGHRFLESQIKHDWTLKKNKLYFAFRFAKKKSEP